MKIKSDQGLEFIAVAATFSQRLQARCKALNLSQRDLAKMVGVSTNTIQSYEGGNLPRGSNFAALAKALGCTLNWLAGIDESNVAINETHFDKH